MIMESVLFIIGIIIIEPIFVGVLINSLLIDKTIQSMNMYTQVSIISGKGETIK